MFMFIVLVLVAPVELRTQYMCHGKTPQGKYDTVLTIEKKDNAYILTWASAAGISAKGIGVRSEDVLAAMYVNPQSQGGVILFKITKGGLEGIWTMGTGQVYKETCTFGLASNA